MEHNLRVVFMGSPEFAVPSMERLISSNYLIVAVYTQPDRPAGRGRSLAPPPVKEAALRNGLTVVQPPDLKSAEAVTELADYHPDLIVVAAFGQILPQSVLDIPHFGCLNIHPSLLPRFRGASPVAAAILAGDDFTGVSIMLLDAGMDTGPMLARAAVSISRLDDSGSLTEKLSRTGAMLLHETLIGWLREEIVPRPQNSDAASYTSPLKKEEGEVRWQQPATVISRQVRAYSPWPGCYTKWRGKKLRITGAVPVTVEAEVEAGRVVALPEGEIAVGIGTGEGILGMLKVQLEGKREMPAAEFLRGQRDFIGSVLPS